MRGDRCASSVREPRGDHFLHSSAISPLLSSNVQPSTAHPPRACCLTAPGRGAVASIRYEGDVTRLDAAGFFRPRNRRPLAEQTIDAIVYGDWQTPTSDEAPPLSEDVVVCRMGSHVLEIHCHGGNVAVDRILGSLAAIGVEVVPASEAGWLWASPVEAACQSVLQQAATQRTALILVDQAALWAREVAWFRREPDADRRQSRLAEIAAWEPFARHLTEPWNVVLCGRPNAGKSSLMNAIAGFARSIVHAVAGTTRDVVTYETAIDGWPVRFSDTAGLRETADPLESQGVRRTQSAMAEADLVIGLFDLSEPPTEADDQLWQQLPRSALRVGNKSDLDIRWRADRLSEVAKISARTGEGLQDLLARLCHRLVPVLPPPDMPLPAHSAWRTWLQLSAAADR